MTTEKLNDKHKDALFKLVFGENKDNALSLYNAINNTDYTNVDDLEITTLNDGLYIGIKNDVSFLFNYDLNLYEHQSSYCPNMPLRGLGYFADLYKIHLGGEDASSERMYDRKLLKIPTPKYYVFYNGTENRDEREDMLLSNAYDGDGDIEVVAHMINVNKGRNSDLMMHCKPMEEYSEFVFRLRDCVKAGLSKEEAAKRTIDDCIRDGVLSGLLRKERDRVENILIRGLTDEEREHLHEIQMQRATEEGLQQGREEGLQQGREEGLQQGLQQGIEQGLQQGIEQGLQQGFQRGKLDDVCKLVADGYYNVDKACELLGVDIEAYKEYISAQTAK